MTTSRFRRGWIASVAVLSLLIGGAVATPEIAFAGDQAPTVETPVFDDPVPGSALKPVKDAAKAESSRNAAIPDLHVVTEVKSTTVELYEVPDAAAPETPAPEKPAPETPAPGETSAPETPAPETPAPETPAPEEPKKDAPAPEQPKEEIPSPELDRGVTTEGGKKSTPATMLGEWRDVGDSGVRVATADADLADTGNDVPDAVEVGILDEMSAAKKGFSGLVVSLTRPAGTDGASIAVQVPEALLTGAFGADYASRLTWVQVPASTGKKDINDHVVPVATAQTDDGLVLTPAVSDEPVLMAAMAGASSANGTGSYAATPLKSSSTWDVAEQTGAFTWTYDMAVPQPGVGPVPTVGLSYNSQSVDGLTASTNNQPSAVGEGWDLSAAGFIERSYIPCAKDDGASGAVMTSGDLCWRTDNATVSIAGHSGALIKDSSSGKWRLQNDDGTRFEHLTGTAQGCAANGTVNTDCWRMTTTDGTQYYFGLNRLPGWTTGKATTNSTWTVPVYGNDTGEPCKASTFAASSCMQAWRWNLDYVVDVHGNAQALYYAAETNKYAKGGSGATVYQRGGALTRIEYGLRASDVYATNGAGYRVLFTYDSRGRCNDATGAKCTTGTLEAAAAPANPTAYPDVPFDQLCTASSCSASQIAPTFFTNASLTKVQSQALVSGAYSTVDTWALGHSYPDPGDGTSAALWLTQVQRTGTAAGQAAIAEPATVFSGTTMQNRVWVVDGLAPLDKWRLSSIKTSLGAVISVNYRPAQCTAAQASGILGDLPNNTKWCFPEWWVPQSTIPLGGRQDLFHKYPVASIQVDPKTAGPLTKVQRTQYVYGTPKWRYNDSPLTVANSRTWNIFAGVDTVEVREGDPAAPSAQKVSKYTYYQGMNGDRAAASGGTKTVKVTGTTIADERWFAGQLHQQQTINGVGGAVVSTQVNTPWTSPVTANDGTRTARMTNVQKTLVTEPVSTGGNRTLETRTTFDNTYGYPLTVSTIPSDAPGTCTTTTYAAANTTKWLLGLPSQVRSVAKTCADASSAQFPHDLISDEKTTYDGAAWGAAATRGLPTSTQKVDRYDNGQPHWATTGSVTYDALGRPLVATDALGRTNKTAYTPAAKTPMLSTVETNPAPFSWNTTTTYEPTTGAKTSIVDPNGSTTTITVDALGRTSKVWLPLQTGASTPSLSFTYTRSQTAPNAIKTDTLTGGGIVTKYELFDGLARPTQTQSAASGGGSVIKTTNYDHQGREYFVDNDYWTDSITPGTAFFTPTSENNIPSQVITTYDAVGRALTSKLNNVGSLHSQTVNAYSGADRVDTVPPTGGTATSTFTNSLGQKTKLVQYLTGAISGTGQATTYAYDGAGNMESMTDPAGNDWTWTYDLLGNRIKQDDADSGVSTATYDLVGNMTSTTDARGVTVTTTYDELNRKTATYAGTASGAKLASWTYDTVRKGLVTTTASYTDSTPGTPGKAYTTTVGAYDAAGNPLNTTLSIPAGAPAFAGTSYKTDFYYFADSTLQAKTVPAMGGLPSETIRYSYTSLGQLSGVRGSSIVLANTVYTPIGQLSQFNRLNGSNSGYSTYGYDQATGQVMAIKDNAVFGGVGHYVADRVYTRDASGNLTSSTINSVLPTAAMQKTCYTYDGLRQLTRAWTPNAATACDAAPMATKMGGLAPMWIDYVYDTQTGNRTGVTTHSSTGAVSTASYTYPAGGAARPHAVTGVTGPASFNPGTYAYDDAGNMTTRPGQQATFNEVGKVSKVVTGTKTQTNVYHADGSLLLRMSSTEGASLTVGDTVLSQAVGSSVVAGFRTYSGTEGKPVAQRSAKTGTTGTTMTWLFTNLEGSVDTQTVANTGVTQRNYRDPYGAPITMAGGAWADGSGYMNKPATASTGLTTVGARTYDPVLGKFLSVDPVIDANLPQQNTGYTYSGNNPATFSDPSGLKFAIDNVQPSGDAGRSDLRRKVKTAPTPSPSPGAAPKDPGQTWNRTLSVPFGYKYDYEWPIASSSHLTPEIVMATFNKNPERVFPFPVSGCDRFLHGSTCTLHSGTPLTPVGDVSVAITPTSTTFHVTSFDYFDPPGSIISFSAVERDGLIYLRQQTDVPETRIDTWVGINFLNGAHGTWKSQAENLREVLHESYTCMGVLGEACA
ncbi:RHS repeat-associated core domain-containing protein [Microbacterium aerolatum]|uniref:RHS repeat-associated core domain-containing protein n=1 Tax=Microbacterium aerolatum TaxID=153731 RepID=UPI00384BFE71